MLTSLSPSPKPEEHKNAVLEMVPDKDAGACSVMQKCQEFTQNDHKQTS